MAIPKDATRGRHPSAAERTCGGDASRVAPQSVNDGEVGSVMQEGACVRIPLSCAGCVLFWLVAAGLLAWSTVAGVEVAGKWALFVSAAAAAWTVILGHRRERRRIVSAMRRAWQEEQLETLAR